MGGGETKSLNLYSGDSSVSEEHQGSLIIQRKYDDQETLIEELNKQKEAEKQKRKKRKELQQKQKELQEKMDKELKERRQKELEEMKKRLEDEKLNIEENEKNSEIESHLPPINKRVRKYDPNKELIDGVDDELYPYEDELYAPYEDRMRRRKQNRSNYSMNGSNSFMKYPRSHRRYRYPNKLNQSYPYPSSYHSNRYPPNSSFLLHPAERRATLIDASKVDRMNRHMSIESEFRKNKKLLDYNEKSVTSQISPVPPPEVIKNYIKTSKLHPTVITCIAPFKPNPRDIAYATSSLDKTIKLWSINFDLIDIIKMISFPSVYLIHYRTKRLLSAEGLYIKVYDILSSMTIKHILRDHIDDVLTMLIMVDNYGVISGGVDRVLRMWSVKEEKCIKYYEGHIGKVTYIDYINHQNNIISMSEDKTFIIWDIDTASELIIFNNYFTSTCLIGTSFGFACGAFDNKLRLYNNEFKLFSVLYGNFYGTENLLMLSGKDLMFVNEKNEICVVDINKRSMRYIYQGVKGDIVQVVKGCDWESMDDEEWNKQSNRLGSNLLNRDKVIIVATEDGYVYEYQCYFDSKPKVIRINNY